ncbi:Clavaminate synthase-like protein [Coniochaeta ligniaria NRRL 30616]|uniref:Clavaminate synthase-like protein n=1 Tax=Coniochaeta ligniaria NRRL 30616 TaxID=1408157 RepID=A0A1J7J435_9PEZI|nr:Clavaminate synthase-like protein [Coniochaeta ligniaria NRRL 30616]
MLLSQEPRREGDLPFEANTNGNSATNGHAIYHDVASDGPAVPLHPLGIKPLGNLYLASGPNARNSIGIFQALPDETLAVLLEYFDQRTVRQLGYTCKFLFALCSSDDVWKGLFLEAQSESKFSFSWRGTWRSTLLNLKEEQVAKVDCNNVFSDVLHRPFVCSNISLGHFTSNIPARNQISRFADLTYDEFASSWSDRPFILTECIRAWPVFQKWTLDTLLKTYADVEFRAEAVDWPFSTYYQYMFNNHDESPLYLFDRKFVEKMGIIVGKEDGAAYWKPDCFGPDLFEFLGAERPAHRWLIIGPERSGSTFHKDPNGTSAWNAVIQGAKYWIMFPPSTAVPGVYVSKDSSEVTSPLSIAEWLLEFHAEARKLPECLEGICNAGEILHVPSGWWHLVVNLGSGIALTQNFVPESHLPEVISFLKDRADQVSGFRRDVNDPYQLFIDRLQEHDPMLLAGALQELERKQERKKRTWDMVVGSNGGEEEEHPEKKSTGFSFGFGFGDDDEEIP